MSLPKINHPTFRVTLPSTGTPVNIRPFTVREEKNLLIAAQEDKYEAFFDCVHDLVSSCVTTPNFDVGSIMMVDLEYLFTQIYARSVTNVLKFRVKDDDGKKYEVELDLYGVTTTPVVAKKKISISDNLHILLKMPQVKHSEQIRAAYKSESSPMDVFFKVVSLCVDKVYDSDKVYVPGEDFTDEELIDFLQSIPAQAFREIEDFISATPQITQTIKYGDGKETTLSGLTDFFM